MNRNGIPQAEMPLDPPPKSAAYSFFAAWRDDGTDQTVRDLQTAMWLGYREPDANAPDAAIVQPAYLGILAEFERADGPLRAGQLCQILDAGTEPKHREDMRQPVQR